MEEADQLLMTTLGHLGLKIPPEKVSLLLLLKKSYSKYHLKGHSFAKNPEQLITYGLQLGHAKMSLGSERGESKIYGWSM